MDYREALHHWDYSNDKCANIDNAQSAFLEDFELVSEETSQYLSNEVVHPVKNNFSLQPHLAENDSKVIEQVITTYDNLESELLKLPEKRLEMIHISVEIPRRSELTRAPCILFSRQISYGPALISPEQLNDTLKPNFSLESLDESSSSARFTTTCATKSLAYLV